MKKGFTLAEVLITLGIIGIVAAMTIPMVVGKYKKQVTISHLQKFYSTMNQAMKRSEADNGEYKYWQNGKEIGAGAYFDKYMKPYLKGVSICTSYSACNYTDLRPFYNIDGTLAGALLINPSARTTFKLPDGTVVIDFVAMGGGVDEDGNTTDVTSRNVMYVDINGGKAPNMFGKDVFIFMKDTNGRIIPYGAGLTKEQISNACNRTKADYCAAKIIQDGWQIKDDYPW